MFSEKQSVRTLASLETRFESLEKRMDAMERNQVNPSENNLVPVHANEIQDHQKKVVLFACESQVKYPLKQRAVELIRDLECYFDVRIIDTVKDAARERIQARDSFVGAVLVNQPWELSPTEYSEKMRHIYNFLRADCPNQLVLVQMVFTFGRKAMQRETVPGLRYRIFRFYFEDLGKFKVADMPENDIEKEEFTSGPVTAWLNA